jgi:hypothetical protein
MSKFRHQFSITTRKQLGLTWCHISSFHDCIEQTGGIGLDIHLHNIFRYVEISRPGSKCQSYQQHSKCLFFHIKRSTWWFSLILFLDLPRFTALTHLLIKQGSNIVSNRYCATFISLTAWVVLAFPYVPTPEILWKVYNLAIWRLACLHNPAISSAIFSF